MLGGETAPRRQLAAWRRRSFAILLLARVLTCALGRRFDSGGAVVASAVGAASPVGVMPGNMPWRIDLAMRSVAERRSRGRSAGKGTTQIVGLHRAWCQAASQRPLVTGAASDETTGWATRRASVTMACITIGRGGAGRALCAKRCHFSCRERGPIDARRHSFRGAQCDVGVGRSSRAAGDRRRRLSFRGSVEPRVESPAGGQKTFDLTLWILQKSDAGAELFWLVDERGRGEFPWSQRFGRTSVDAQSAHGGRRSGGALRSRRRTQRGADRAAAVRFRETAGRRRDVSRRQVRLSSSTSRPRRPIARRGR